MMKFWEYHWWDMQDRTYRRAYRWAKIKIWIYDRLTNLFRHPKVGT